MRTSDFNRGLGPRANAICTRLLFLLSQSAVDEPVDQFGFSDLSPFVSSPSLPLCIQDPAAQRAAPHVARLSWPVTPAINLPEHRARGVVSADFNVGSIRISKEFQQESYIVEAITNYIDPQQPLSSDSTSAGAQSHTNQSTLSQAPDMPSSACTRSSSPSSHTDSQYSTYTDIVAGVNECVRGSEAWLQLKAVDIPSSYQLGSLSVNNTVALELFQHFDRYYRPHAKFLRPIQHEAMLSAIFVCAPLTIEMMHALLCLCLWPVPKVRLWQDLSWGYIGLVVNSAMGLNCHLPSNPLLNAQLKRNSSRRAVPNIDAAVRDTTWLACFDISTRLSEFLGFSSSFSSTYHLSCISRARERASNLLGPSGHMILEIRRLSLTSMAKLDMVTDSALHFSQTQSSISELELLRRSDQRPWSPETELTLQGTKLYLYAMTLLLPPPKDLVVALQATSNRDTVLISGLMCASTMISDMLQQIDDKPNQGSDKNTCSAAFWPKTQISYMFFAATFIFRVLLSHSSLTPQDITLAMSRLADAHAVSRMEPLHPDRTRAAGIIQRLIEVARSYMIEDSGENDAKDLLPRGLLVTGRLGASVMFDAVLRSVHHQRQNTQTRKSLSLKFSRVTPMPGTEMLAGGEASSNIGLIGDLQSVEAHGDAPSRSGGIGFGDMFDFEFMDTYEYIMSTDSSLILDSLEDPVGRI
ncbi:transcription factor SEF1 [Fusarium napiforme]|uniref:Transcription factor SEF1 n=1 Tax=Fusarium napiforme TaxID=42672 RepID=A0A8H5IIU2_9HYPO|nr:transcription factor SEF1 [Fusarium napiforme]